MGNRVLIIGSDSVIGGYFADYLERKNYEIVRFSLSPENYHQYGYELFKDLVSDNFDYVVNFLGLFSGEERVMFHVNVQLPVELMLAVKDTTPNTRFILIGSAAEYGKNSDYKEGGIFNPSSFYGITKYLQFVSFEKITNMYGLNGVYARIFNVMSSHINKVLFPGSFGDSIIKYLKGEVNDIKLGNIEIVRDYLNLRMLSKLLEDIMLKGIKGEDYNICSGYGIYIKEFVFNVLKKVGIGEDRVAYVNSTNSIGNTDNDVIGNTDKLSRISHVNNVDIMKDLVKDYVEEIRNILERES